jgi:hypothetical protein
VDVLGFGGLGYVPSRPGTGHNEAFAFQYRDSCGDGAAYDAVSSLEGARAWELDAESVAAGTDGFGRFGGDSCCGWATHSSQSSEGRGTP